MNEMDCGLKKMNEMHYGLKEIKMKCDQGSCQCEWQERTWGRVVTSLCAIKQ